MKSRAVFSNRRLRILVLAHGVWLTLICVLGGWWGRLVLKQAQIIERLQMELGVSPSDAHLQWERTRRMLYWESSSFFPLILLSAGFGFWVYWRDMKRARSTEAFFASVTHELRTPLTSIRLQAESIGENFSENSSERALVGRLMEDTIRLESQVERTLELARVEGGGPVFLQEIELKPWLERMLQPWKDAYGARLEIDTSKVEDVTIEADPTCLQTVLKNLVENSIRHSQKDKIRITLESYASGNRVRLAFQDDGNGFAGNAKKLGSLFYRGNSSLGTGVGLYLIRTLMLKMGGDANFSQRSTPGFRVQLNFVRENANGG